MNTPSVSDFQHRERTAQLLWTGGIVGFFAIQAVLWAVALTLTHRDQSHAIIADYDSRALNWDAWQAQLSASNNLGWKADISVPVSADRSKQSELLVSITDTNGELVRDATLSIDMFHCGRAANKEHVQLNPADDGKYVGKFRLDRSGLWQFDVVAQRGSDRFIHSERLSLGDELINRPANRYLDKRRQP